MNFKLGEWLVVCDRCKFKRFASQVTKTWDGLIVCKPSVKQGCFETRHPQDFVRGVKDDTSVEFVRARPTDIFASFTFNCATAEQVTIRQFDVVDRGSKIIGKGLSNGPIEIINTVVTVNCEWIIA